MNIDRELLELECRVRLAETAASQDPDDEPLDLFVEGFWEGVRAVANPRSRERLEAVLEKLSLRDIIR